MKTEQEVELSEPSFIEKALECPLCLSLICEPLSISCGHSFCRVCLVKSLRRWDSQEERLHASLSGLISK